MRNYQKLHYHTYFLMNEDNSTVPCDRQTCFAAPEDLPGCAYPQRWFYDPEAGYAVRLSRNAHGDAIGRRCMADLTLPVRKVKRCVCRGETLFRSLAESDIARVAESLRVDDQHLERVCARDPDRGNGVAVHGMCLI